MTFQGLPARIGWLGHGERSRLAVKVNEAVASGALKGPIAFTRDHLDGGSAAMPFRETGNMRDGSDAIADWPILNALLNGAAGADLVAIHGLADYGKSAGLTIVADGTPAAAQRLRTRSIATPAWESCAMPTPAMTMRSQRARARISACIPGIIEIRCARPIFLRSRSAAVRSCAAGAGGRRACCGCWRTRSRTASGRRS